MRSNKTSSRRGVLRTVALSAIVFATFLSVLEAAAKGDVPSQITLADGSLLIIQKIGGVGRGLTYYVAKRQVGDKVVDEKPTGSFTGKNGQLILLDKGKVLQPLRLEQAR